MQLLIRRVSSVECPEIATVFSLSLYFRPFSNQIIMTGVMFCLCIFGLVFSPHEKVEYREHETTKIAVLFQVIFNWKDLGKGKIQIV